MVSLKVLSPKGILKKSPSVKSLLATIPSKTTSLFLVSITKDLASVVEPAGIDNLNLLLAYILNYYGVKLYEYDAEFVFNEIYFYQMCQYLIKQTSFSWIIDLL